MLWFEQLVKDHSVVTAFLGASMAIGFPLLFNFGKDIYFDRRKRSEERRYIYVQLVFLLDKFVAKCADVGWDKGYDPSFQEPEERELKAQVKSPIFDMSSVKGEHKYLEADMLYKLHNIEIELQMVKDALTSFTNDPNFGFEYLKDYYRYRREKYIELGINVSRITDELRRKYKLKKVDGWEPEQRLIESLNEIKKHRSQMALLKMERKARIRMSSTNNLPF